MRSQGPFTYALAFFQGGEVRHAEPLPRCLLQRVYRAAQFQGVRSGFLPSGDPCRAWLAPVGAYGPRGSSSPFFAHNLRVVVQSDAATYVREMGLSAFLPWARPIAAVLAQEGRLAADVPYDLHLFVAPTDGGGSEVNGHLPPFTIIDNGTHLSAKEGFPLHPPLAYAIDVPVLMPTAALLENLAYCQADPAVERAGVFLGYLGQDTQGELRVEACHFCPALYTEAASATVRFTRETWAAIHQQRRELGADLQVVAWSHSHPRFAIEGAEEPVALFLFPEDIAIMAAFFDLPHLFAIVVDAEGSADPAVACAIYGWDEAGVGLVQRSLTLHEAVEDL